MKRLLWLALFVWVSMQACASTKRLSSVQVEKDALPFELKGPAIVEVCASWSDPCVINAKVFDEVCDTVCAKGVQVITVLVDEDFEGAHKAYVEGFQIRHDIVRPSLAVLSGKSALGSVNDIPGIYVFDSDGKLRREVRGGIASVEGLFRALEDLGLSFE